MPLPEIPSREMNVAMSSERADSSLIAQPETVARDEPPDATEPELWEFLLPRIEQRHGAIARNREQQFKILAVRQRGDERGFGGVAAFGDCLRGAADRNRRLEQFRTQRIADLPSSTHSTGVVWLRLFTR